MDIERFMSMERQYPHQDEAVESDFDAAEDEVFICTHCGLAEEHRPPGPCIGALLKIYRDMKIEIAMPLEQLYTIETAVKQAARLRVQATGERNTFMAVDGARIKSTPPRRPRVTWNTAALDGYAAAHPEILEFRTEKWAAPSIKLIID